MRAAMPSARRSSPDIVFPSMYSSTITERSGRYSRMRGLTPVVAAASALYRSFTRSTASSSVATPGIRTTYFAPSASTR